MQENNLSDQDVSRTQIIDTGSNTKLLNDDDTSIHIDAEQVLETILLEDISLPHWKLPCGKSMSCIEGYHKTDEYHTTEDYSSSRETIHLLKRSRSFAPIGIGIDEDSFKINTKSSVIFRNSLRWSILERVDDKIEEIECEQNENGKFIELIQPPPATRTHTPPATRTQTPPATRTQMTDSTCHTNTDDRFHLPHGHRQKY